MTDEVEKVVEIGSFQSIDKPVIIKVMLRQRVQQEVFFACEETIGNVTEGRALPPLELKQVRQLRRLLGQAENKMRKLIDKMAKEKRRGKQG
jgi:hypothetical protein